MGIKSSVITALVGATLVGGVGIASAASSSTTTSATPTAAPAARPCLGQHDDNWPLYVDGRPAGFDSGDKSGFYIWHSEDGWHLRVTHATNDLRTFSGVIETSGTITAQPFQLEKNDRMWVGPDGHELHFFFYNYGHVDGVDLQTSCAPALHFALSTDGNPAAASIVDLGHNDVHPDQVPFTVLRRS